MSNDEKAGRGIPVAPSVARQVRSKASKRQADALVVVLACVALGFILGRLSVGL